MNIQIQSVHFSADKQLKGFINKKVEKLVSDLRSFKVNNSDSDYLDELNHFFSNSSFPIELKYQPCLTAIVGDNLNYYKKL